MPPRLVSALIAFVVGCAGLTLMATPASAATTLNVTGTFVAEEPIQVSGTSSLDSRGFAVWGRQGTDAFASVGQWTYSNTTRSFSEKITLSKPGVWELRTQGIVRYYGSTTGWGWDSDVSAVTTITVAPAFPKVTAQAPNVQVGSFTVPTITGVTYQYLLGSVWTPVPAAGVTGRAAYQVRAVAATGYRLQGTSSFTADTRQPVTVSAPTAADGSLQLPQIEGVEWRIAASPSSPTSSTPVSPAGTLDVAPGFWNVSAALGAEYRLADSSSPTTWTQLDARTSLSSPAPHRSGNQLTVPTVSGVRHRLGADLVAAGTILHITAPAQITAEVVDPATTRLTGASWWSFDPEISSVAPVAPAASAARVEVPVQAGISYEFRLTSAPDNEPWTALPATGAVPMALLEVRAVAVDATWLLLGTTRWSVDTRQVFTPTAPKVDLDNLSLTLPIAADGSVWRVDGQITAAGTRQVTGTVRVVADPVDPTWRAADGATTSWTYEFGTPEVVLVVPPASDPARSTVLLPDLDHVTWRVNGKVRAPGLHRELGELEVTATTPGIRYPLSSGGTTATWSFDHRLTVRPEAPVFSPDSLTVTIPEVEGVQYAMTDQSSPQVPVALAPGTHPARGSVVVTASPRDARFLLAPAAVTRWTTRQVQTTFRAPAPTLAASGRAVKIPADSRVRYRINGKVVAAGQHRGTTVVTVTAQAATLAHRLRGTTTWRFDLRTAVRVKAPSFTRATGRVVFKRQAGVSYVVTVHQAGKKVRTARFTVTRSKKVLRIKRGQRIKVTAAPLAHHRLTGRTAWTFRR